MKSSAAVLRVKVSADGRGVVSHAGVGMLREVAELTGLEGDIEQMQEIFKYVRTGTAPDGTVLGHFQATGVRPRFLGDLINMGIKIPGSYFDPSQQL